MNQKVLAACLIALTESFCPRISGECLIKNQKDWAARTYKAGSITILKSLVITNLDNLIEWPTLQLTLYLNEVWGFFQVFRSLLMAPGILSLKPNCYLNPKRFITPHHFSLTAYARYKGSICRSRADSRESASSSFGLTSKLAPAIMDPKGIARSVSRGLMPYSVAGLNGSLQR